MLNGKKVKRHVKFAALLPEELVASGDFAVRESKRGKLTAFLGTCVGVTVCDQFSNVGGLIHLLLPYWFGNGEALNPLSYARSGLPLFLESLYKAGAKKENLIACVAGGALIGQPSSQDLYLNIGGRTVDEVERFLRNENIPIREAETGGYHGYRLSLNLQTWETLIEPIGAPLGSWKEISIKKLTDAEVDQAIQDVQPIPQVAMKIVPMFNEPNLGMLDIAKEIRQDQVVSAKLLRLCNSALFGVKGSVDTIERALVMLGERKVISLMLSVSLESFFPTEVGGYSLCKGGLYKHSLGVAIICEQLAHITHVCSPELAYTAGLLHDIGKVALDQYVAQFYPFFYRRAQLEGTDLTSIEWQALGITHQEAGKKLAEEWSFPDNLTEAIANHHLPERSVEAPGLTHLVYLADLFCSQFFAGQDIERPNADALESRLQAIGLTLQQLPTLIASIPFQLFGDQSGDFLNCL